MTQDPDETGGPATPAKSPTRTPTGAEPTAVSPPPLSGARPGDAETVEVPKAQVGSVGAGVPPPPPAPSAGQRSPLLTSDQLVGQRIGQYQILDHLGRGGMGLVYVAQDLHSPTNERVAIKFLRPEASEDEHLRHLFLKEAENMHRMREPAIMPVTQVVRDASMPYYVMPLMEGGNLSSRMREGKPFEPLSDLLKIVIPVAEALQYSHDRRGVIHRDIKPENILLDLHGRPYLSDFGLIRTVFNDTLLPNKRELGFTVGTKPYMAPEVVNGFAGDFRVDIYSFGAMLYELCTGRKPYIGASTDEIFAKIKLSPPPPPRQVNTALPEGWATIIEAAMGRELHQRYAHMKYLVEDLKRLEAGQPPVGISSATISAASPAGPPVLPRSPEVTSFNPPPAHGGAVAAAPRSSPQQSSAAPEASRGFSLGCAAMVSLAILLAGGGGYAIFRYGDTWFGSDTPKPTPTPPGSEQVYSKDEQEAAYRRIVQAIRDGNLPAIEGNAKVLNPNRTDLADSAAIRREDSILSRAVESGNVDTLRKVIECRVHYDHADAQGSLAIHYAAQQSNATIFEILVKDAQKNPVQGRGGDGLTPLHLAAKTGMTEVVKKIIELAPAAGSVRDGRKQLPLHTLAQAKPFNSDILEILLADSAPDLVNTMDVAGQTPLHLAAAAGNNAACAALLGKGANRSIKDERGRTPADLATSLGTDRDLPSLFGEGSK